MLLFQIPFQFSPLLSHSFPATCLHPPASTFSLFTSPTATSVFFLFLFLPPPSGSHFTQAAFLADFLATNVPLPHSTYVLLGNLSHFQEAQTQAPLFGLVLDDPVGWPLCPIQAGCSPQTGSLSRVLLTPGALTHCYLSLRPAQILPPLPSRNLSHFPCLG